MQTGSNNLWALILILTFFLPKQQSIQLLVNGEELQCVYNSVSHQINSNWLENGCLCTCNFDEITRIPMVICEKDNCSTQNTFDVHGNYGNLGYLIKDSDIPIGRDPKFISLTGAPIDLIEHENDCIYKSTGIRYRNGEEWPSVDEMCTNCKCVYGFVDCQSNFKHCPNSNVTCGIGKLKMNRCCEVKCILDGGNEHDPVYEDLVHSKFVEGKIRCLSNGKYFDQGFVLSKNGYCVDEKCICTSGQWKCVHTCLGNVDENIAANHFSCQRESMFLWDPFCCPRCVGNHKCSVKISTNISLSDTTEIEPGGRFILKNRDCTCINGKTYCSRIGRSIWYEENLCWDPKTGYKRVGSHWTHFRDKCLDCECILVRENITKIKCQTKICPDLLCNDNQKPKILKDNQCCASVCVDSISETEEKYEEDDNSSPVLPDLSSENNFDFYANEATNVEEFPFLNNIEEEELEPMTTTNLGCRPLNDPILNFDTSDTEPLFIPFNSAQIINLNCRSLLCKCTDSGGWLCSDYCPLCSNDEQDSIEEMNSFLSSSQRDKNGCCLPCKDTVYWLMKPMNDDRQVSLLSDREKRVNYQSYASCLTELNNWKIITFVAFCLIGLLLGFVLFVLYRKCRVEKSSANNATTSFREFLMKFVHNDSITVKHQVICRTDIFKRPSFPWRRNRDNQIGKEDFQENDGLDDAMACYMKKTTSLPCIISNQNFVNNFANSTENVVQYHKKVSDTFERSSMSIFKDVC